MDCPICTLAMENDRLREAAKQANRTSGVRCWVRDDPGEVVVTVYGEIDREHRKRLFALLAEIEKS